MIPPQAFVSPSLPQPRRIRPVAATRMAAAPLKPEGGLWTADYIDGSSAWVRYCRQVGGALALGPNQRLWRLAPDPDARVLTLRHQDQLQELIERYGATSTHALGQPMVQVHWDRIAQDYEAVRLEHPQLVYAVDVPSTVWFRWSFTSVARLALA